MLFFFSSRRRHTRWTGDWSSDVCSSDLLAIETITLSTAPTGGKEQKKARSDDGRDAGAAGGSGTPGATVKAATTPPPAVFSRSEERRVGKECRTRWATESRRKTS